MSASKFQSSMAFLRATVVCSLVVLGPSIFFAQPATAGTFTLVDDNSEAGFDTDSQANALSWSVDGIDQLFQQAFWFRVGNVAEQSLDTLVHPTEGTTDTNFDGDQDTLFVRYNGNGFDVEVRYTLDGGTLNSGAADMGEQISIISRSNSPLDVHFFQYVDFDLQGTSGGDSAYFTNSNSVRQSEGSLRLTETVVTPVPNHREIDFWPNTVNNLNDGVATTLSDTPSVGTILGPSDVAWAFQWDFSLAPGGTFQISKDKNLSAVPEPLALVPLVSIVISLLAAWRKR